MLTRDDVLAMINNTGVQNHMGSLQKAILSTMTKMLVGNHAPEDPVDENKRRQKQDCVLLDMVGPAAASAAVEHSISVCRKANHYSNLAFNGSYVHNVRLVHNDDDSNFSMALRQYLLPRYAYTDFDSMVDPRHRVDFECGYPRYITPIMYRYMYDRDDVARRVVDVYPNESWSVDPEVYEVESEEEITDFEQSWKDICEDHNVLASLFRLDKACGIGHFGGLLIGLEGETNLEAPINESDLLAGVKGSISKKERKILYLRPFDEYLCFVESRETNLNHPRFGQPTMYNVVFLDMTVDATGSSQGTRINKRVHWTRVIHAEDNDGTPRQQPVFNRLLDLRKEKSGGAEMFWKGAFGGISFEVDPKFVADNPEWDPEQVRDQVEKYFNGQQRGLFLQGVSAKSLPPTVIEHPELFVKIQMEAISCSLEMPLRVFMGSEEGRLSSSQDMQTWNRRLGRRCRLFVAPGIIRNFIDRMIAIGAMRPPKSKRYFVEWPDLDAPTDEDKANLSLKWTQAMSQYVATGMIHLIEPMDYLTMILGLRPSQAKKIVDSIEKNGGWAKLKAVDPAQGAGVNGVRENITTPGQKNSTTSTATKQASTADKKATGLTS